MRVARRRRRVADLEWFEALYKVYMAAFVVGGTILFLSGLVGDVPLGTSEVADIGTHGPSILGVVMAASIWIGARSGAVGGPISIEEAEVRHLLLAPVPRSIVLRAPLVQRMRAMAFAGALAGAVSGQLFQRRLSAPGHTMVEWAFWGAVGGACAGIAFVAVAALTHQFAPARRRWVVTLAVTTIAVWQIAAAIPSNEIRGPFDPIGRVFLWPLEGRPIDLTVLFVVGGSAAIPVVTAGRFSLESLARRSALVSQLRFAVTLQDIRTVVLLRRQLGGEFSRTEPWIRARALWRRNPVAGRSIAGIARFPARRFVRMAVMAGAAAVCAVLAWRGTTPMVVLAGALVFLLGLEAIEPLSQEIDQPDRTDSLPVERGFLHVRLLIGPALALVPYAVLSVVVALVLEPGVGTAALAAIIAPAAMLTGLAGATVNAMMGAPDPVSTATGGLALPPEVSGIGNVVRAAWPPAIACTGMIPVLTARWARDNGFHVVAEATRTSLAVCLLVGLVGGWVRQRDAIKAWFRNAQAGSRAASSPTGTAGIAQKGK